MKITSGTLHAYLSTINRRIMNGGETVVGDNDTGTTWTIAGGNSKPEYRIRRESPSPSSDILIGSEAQGTESSP